MSFFRWSKGDDEQPPGEGRTADEPEVCAEQPPNLQTPPLQLPPSPPLPELPAGQYASSEQHLWDELQRVDQFVRAQTVRWRLTVGASKPDEQWGMAYIDDAEIGAFLNAPFTPPGMLPPELETKLAVYWKMADLMAESIKARRAETPPGVTLRLGALRRLCGLRKFERDILLVCLLPELDARYRRLYAYLQDDASRKKPSIELILQILHKVTPALDAALSAFAAQSPLLRHHLIVLSGDAESDEPPATRSVRVDDRITGYLLGSDLADDRLKGILNQPRETVRWERVRVEPELLKSLQALSEWWQKRRDEGARDATLLLHGSYGSGRLAAARAFCSSANSPLIVADAPAATRSPQGFELAVDLAYREAKLLGACLYWSRCEQLLEFEQSAPRWEHLIASAEEFEGLTFLASQSLWDPVGRFRKQPFLRLDFHAPGYELRRELWEAHLPPAEQFVEPPERHVLAEQLANAFQLTEGQVEDASASAGELAALRDPVNPRLTIDDLYEGCRRQSNRNLATFARRIEPRAKLTFDDLVLPPPHKRQLDELRQRIKQRHRVRGQFENRLTLGQGLIALFTGSSGTGKTMAAELLAQEQGVDLYKVDLSAVVSKYVGETEKNLNRVFAEAEDANAIIFFDEGEALFGQRGSRTETGQDRWANMEVNFLLQRVEEYTGVVIIASNLRQNIDEAFMRRTHYSLEFPFPEQEARLRIWLGMFPPGVARPKNEEVSGLADLFRLSGGQISNIVVDAAFRALAEAGDKEPEITLRHLVLAIAREYQKMGKPITRGEFGETFYDWIERDILLTKPSVS
jgi:hypothetical protein